MDVTIKVNGRERTASVAAETTLLSLLRDSLDLPGAKLGCDVGDCGACTVLVDGMSVNACLMLAAQVQDRDVTTIEGLGDYDHLHPLQAVFEQESSFQCGFCAPGMIISAKALLDENPKPTEYEIREALSGNLCRCTGYGPIINAAKEIGEISALTDQEKDNRAEKRLLESLQGEELIEIKHAVGKAYLPANTDQLAQLYVEHPDATLIAGATDVGLWVTKQHRKLPVIIFLNRVNDLARMEVIR